MTKRWTEIGLDCTRARFELLSEFIKRAGVDNKVDFIETSKADFPQILETAKNEYEGIRIGRGLGEPVCKLFKYNLLTIRELKAGDCIRKKNDGWWIDCASYYALQRKIAALGRGLDIEKEALIVGAGAMARIAIACMVKAGMKHFNITNWFAEQAQEMIVELKKTYFGIQFTFVPKEELILLRGENSVVANTTPLMKHNDILNELYYFNFLKPPGLVVDFVVAPPMTPFLKEAKGVGAALVSGYELSVLTDTIWANWTFGANIDTTKYQEELRPILESEGKAFMEKEGISESLQDSGNT